MNQLNIFDFEEVKISKWDIHHIYDMLSKKYNIKMEESAMTNPTIYFLDIPKKCEMSLSVRDFEDGKIGGSIGWQVKFGTYSGQGCPIWDLEKVIPYIEDFMEKLHKRYKEMLIHLEEEREFKKKYGNYDD